MAAMTGALTTTAGVFGPSPTSYIANVVDSGQNGFGPLLQNLDGNTPQVYIPLQLTVMRVPTIFHYITNGPAIFKSLFETHLISMEGLDLTYEMETDGTPVGRDGQQQMVPTRQTRSQLTPSATWPEKIGNVIFNLGRVWMNAMHDIDTQAASLASIIPSTTTLPPMVSSMYSADLMLTQFDTTYRPENIIDAIALTNFFPTEIGSPGYRLNQIEVTRPDREFTFTCIAQHNNNTVAVAKTLATLTNLHTYDYQNALPIATQVEAALQGEGMEYQVAQYLSQFKNMDGSLSS